MTLKLLKTTLQMLCRMFLDFSFFEFLMIGLEPAFGVGGISRKVKGFSLGIPDISPTYL